MLANTTAIELFKAKAAQVSTIVAETKNLEAALEYALDVCEKKEPCQLLLATAAKTEPRSQPSQSKVLAAPGLPDSAFSFLAQKGKAKGITVRDGGLRNHLAGIEVGFTIAEFGIAETATAVMPCYKEEQRLASMICETHIMALSKRNIVNTSYDVEDYLQKLMKDAMYTAFISGCSRTSDIERVLTLGVHGPLELHVVLMEE